MTTKRLFKIARQIVLGILITVIAIQPVQVFAAPPEPAEFDEKFFSQNDVLFYGAGGCKSVSSGTVGGVKLQGEDNATQIWNFLRGLDGNLPKDRALNEEQAAGLMGNIRQEAGEKFDPATQEKNPRTPPGGYGIVQWTDSRRANLEKAARKKGVAVSDLAFQLRFMYEESNSRSVSSKVAAQGFGKKGANEWTTMREQVAKNIQGKPRTAIENATVFWHNNFEVSADTADFVLNQRGAFSKEIYAKFTGKTAPEGAPVRVGGAQGSCSKDGEAFTGGDLTETTLAYAWPQYHKAPYTTKKPEYDAAVKKAQSEGRYVGGLEYPGVDCGGFVTTLMVDSGFEPNYNHGGKSNKGAGFTEIQRAWAESNWKTIGRGSSINVADLRPGDVAFSPGHTFAYVGTIPGFDSKIASASVSFNGDGWRSPMAGKESPTSGDVTWFRKGV